MTDNNNNSSQDMSESYPSPSETRTCEPQSIVNLLDALRQKDMLIRDLRRQLQHKDDMLRRVGTELIEERQKNAAKRKASEEQQIEQAASKFLKQDEWDECMNKLKEYKAKYGNVFVPRNYQENPALSRFVDKQRQLYKKIQDDGIKGVTASRILTDERIKELESMGFVWKVGSQVHDLKWMKMYDALCEFREKEGNTRVPTSYDSSLHNWVQNQRGFYKNTICRRGKIHQQLSEERIAKLQLLGFEWEVAAKATKAAWETRFQDLITFKAQHNHCRVPREYKANQKLGNWVKEQRKNYKRFKSGKGRKGLTDERIRRLEEIGFEWRILQPTVKELLSTISTSIDNSVNGSNNDDDAEPAEEAVEIAPLKPTPAQLMAQQQTLQHWGEEIRANANRYVYGTSYEGTYNAV